MIDKTKMKPLKDLVLTDRFLFASAMEDPVISKNSLEIILGKEMRLINLPQVEKEIRTSPLLRAIRLDVYTMDEDVNIYNLEVQKANTGNLPKRIRFYQALVDSALLEPGCIDFNQLNDCFMITVMPFDLYNRGFYRYTFTMRCEEDLTLCMGDGATRIFLNTRGTNEDEVSPELVEFLHYMEKTDDASSEAATSERIKEIHKRILKIKSSEEIGVKYMQAWEEKALAKAEGEARGEVKEAGRYSRLILKLSEEGNLDMVVRIAEDSDIRKQLYQEYGI